jgi:imidazolonepropionase-like amidohydrolase
MMSQLPRWLLLVVLPVSASCTSPPNIEADYVFENVNVVPMNEETVLASQAVAVRDGKIVAIVDQSRSADIIAGRRIDGADRYLMPGLADMHVHVRWSPQAMFNLFLANGVTTVTNMGLGDGVGSIDHLSLRNDVASGNIVGPRYLISGPQLHADQLATIDQVAPMLDRHVEQRFDVLKVHGDLPPEIYDALLRGARERSLRVTGHAQQLMPLSESLRMDSIEHIEEFLYVSRDAKFGKAAAGSLENFLGAYSSNLQRLAKPEERAAILHDVAASDIYVAPSLIIYKYIQVYLADDLFEALHEDARLAYLPESVRNEYLNSDTNEYRRDLAVVFGKHLGAGVPVDVHFAENIRLLSTLLYEMHKVGVPLLLSTDSFGAAVPGYSVHQELELLVTAGLTPYEALQTGTVNVAAYLGEEELAGTIEVGKRADFVLLEQNPLIDIKHAATVKGVFTHGRWHSETGIRDLLIEAKQVLSSGNKQDPNVE